MDESRPPRHRPLLGPCVCFGIIGTENPATQEIIQALEWFREYSKVNNVSGYIRLQAYYSIGIHIEGRKAKLKILKAILKAKFHPPFKFRIVRKDETFLHSRPPGRVMRSFRI